MTDPLDPIAAYYAGRLAEHGVTARGVDWNGTDGQTRRFVELCRVIDLAEPFSVNDLGCGYGALHDFLTAHYPTFDYRGFDIAPAMVAATRHRLGAAAGAVGAIPDRIADFGMASGIFNVRLGAADGAWQTHVVTTLDVLNRTSRRGFAFNCLTRYSDADRMRPDLYYADPLVLFDHCKRHYARDVALMHDYGLYEFTILVRKAP
jgi:SAM-dependent methyltransferase